MSDAPHIPIMVAPILERLAVAERPNAVWVDGTLGAGGHSHAILSVREDSRLIGFDLDPQALALARERLAAFGDRATLHHASYADMETYLAGQLVDGILLDLGISSMQIDTAERGFAFRLDGALDMRFNPLGDAPTAAEIVNSYAADELANIIYTYGEEPDSRRIARAIMEHRPIETTTQLADIVATVSRNKHKKIHPATRTFQALRIAVNDELNTVERVIEQAITALKVGGRLAIMSFHSLEDRIVKQAFKLAATDCICPPKQPICTCNHVASVRLLSRKPIVATPEEVEQNPRARSAKLRIVEKV